MGVAASIGANILTPLYASLVEASTWSATPLKVFLGLGLEVVETPKCPKCGKEIDFLKNYVSGITEEYNLSLDRNGEPDYEYANTLTWAGDGEYRCPRCDEALFKDEEEAVKFLKGGEEA